MTGIPTKHKGRQFRSRLEARWANFFDLVGWRYEYEPFDLPGWIPDFLLLGEHEEVLVEVKPVTEYPKELADEISRCPGAAKYEVLIVGCVVPTVVKQLTFRQPTTFGRGVPFGWLGGDTSTFDYDDGSLIEAGDWNWDDAVLGRWERKGTIGFGQNTQSFRDRISGDNDGVPGGLVGLTLKEVEPLWAEAANRVQWMPPSR
jgi:hypothetical protein